MDQQTYVSHTSINICTPVLGAVGALGGLLLGHVMGGSLLLTAVAGAVGIVAGAALNLAIHFCQEKYHLKDSTVRLIHAATFAVLGTALMVTAIASGIYGSVSLAIFAGICGLSSLGLLAYAMMQKHNESIISMPESNQCKLMKQQIADALKKWSRTVPLENFKGENLKIFYGHKIGLDTLIGPYSVKKSREEFDKFLEETICQKAQDRIFPNYGDSSTFDIELLIVGARTDQAFNFQLFSRSYKGNICEEVPGDSDISTLTTEDYFMQDFVKDFKLLEIPAKIWNEDGSFKV